MRPDAADSLVLAITITRAALSYGYRALKRIDNVSRTDFMRATCQSVAAIGAAGRGYEPGTGQGFE